MNKELTLAVVGATGEVGRAVLEALEDTELPTAAVRVFATARSEEAVEIPGGEERTSPLSEGAFRGCDVAIFCTPSEVSRTWAPRANASGCRVVDVSNTFRGDLTIPLVLPEVNPEALPDTREIGIVACPSPIATALALVLSPLKEEGLRSVVATVLASASGEGRAGVMELERQARDLFSLREPEPAARFPHRLAFNAVPQAGKFLDSGETEVESAVTGEVRRLLGLPELGVSTTVVRVPVFYGDLVTLTIEADRPLGVDVVRERLKKTTGVKVIDSPAESVYPMPMLAAREAAVLVGRLRSVRAKTLELVLAYEAARRSAATALDLTRRLFLNH